MVNVRLAKISELDALLSIYERARVLMRNSGNPNQWKSNYPDESVVTADINAGCLYVVEEDDVVHGVFMFAKGPDPTYFEIEGNWLNSDSYHVIHRVASAGTKKGFLRDCLVYALSVSNNIKIDTHKENSIMRHQLQKLGFKECGIITLKSGDKRIAYQLTV